MSGRDIRLRPKAMHFKSRDKRATFFRRLVKRTDARARRNRWLFELDQRRIEAGPFAPHSALASQPDAPQAGR